MHSSTLVPLWIVPIKFQELSGADVPYHIFLN